MLRIRPEQYEVLAAAQRTRFIDECAAFVREYWAEEYAAQGLDAVKQTAEQAIERAQEHGIEQEAGVLRFLNVMYALGIDFDRGADFPWAVTILENRDLPEDEKLARLEAEVERHL